jgi:hypothetical protein
MTAPCSRCQRADCSASCIRVEEALERQRLAEGTQNTRLLNCRVAIAYQHIHTRKGEPPITETRHAFGKVTSILPDGALWVVTDREGGIRTTSVEVVG